MKTSKTTLKLIPFKYLISTTYHPHDMEFLSESVSKVVSVKKKLNELYLSLNTGGVSLPFDVMQVADIIDKLKGKMGAKLSKNASFSKKPNETIELTLLSDKGVKWLNTVNSIVKETKNKENRIVTAGIVEEIEIEKMVEQLLKSLDEFDTSELLWED